MGAAIGAQATAAGHQVLWVPNGRSQETRRRAQAAGLTAASSLRAALDASTIVVSVCPPDAADQISSDVNQLGFTGLYLDANAISPERVCRLADGMTAMYSTVRSSALHRAAGSPEIGPHARSRRTRPC